jgi:hypothetical protein
MRFYDYNEPVSLDTPLERAGIARKSADLVAMAG